MNASTNNAPHACRPRVLTRPLTQAENAYFQETSKEQIAELNMALEELEDGMVSLYWIDACAQDLVSLLRRFAIRQATLASSIKYSCLSI